MGPSPILNSEIESWLNIHGIVDQWARTDVYKAVRALDSVWRLRMQGKIKRDDA